VSYVIGVDGGTESLRAFVFDLDGRPLGSHATAYKTDFPEPSWAEQDPEDWWQALGASVKGALTKAHVAAQDVITLCVDTTCCSELTEVPDAPALGCAILAACGAGRFATIEEGCKAMVRRRAIIEPESRRTRLYEREIYPRYVALYGALKSVRDVR
jgi:sugar (pentulose or hexulose) kinase